jgi:hypothetical protein
MLMSIKNIAATKGFKMITRDDADEVTGKAHNKGHSKRGRRQIKRAENQRVAREEIRNR